VDIWPGSPYPLGLRYNGSGANVAVHAPSAELVELCLFDDDGVESRIGLPELHGGVHYGELPDIEPGTRYGFRCHGPFDPRAGLLNNPAKLLLDPYALAVEGTVTNYEACRIATPDGRPDPVDSAPHAPRSVVVSPFFEWGNDSPPHIEPADLVIYEAHVKGATRLHPDVPAPIRGTYAGLADDAFVQHLLRLGVNCVELLPIQQHLPEAFLVERGLTNYWGYSPIAWFAPHNGYAARGQRGDQVAECKRMVRELHRHGIEVYVDVVYNHTGEGGHDGPTVSLRGFDPMHYRSDPADRTRYIDYTGCGNTLNMVNPWSLQITMDSLRYWVQEMHVDGFRFDLASTLAREEHAVDRVGSFFDLMQQDPVMRSVKLIAEPWDVGDGGYQVGNFPPQWGEWNGRYRDTVRDYWRGTPGLLPELATRLSGSADLYADDGRTPFHSVNFITAHDGFTMRDLVSFNDKHNEANGEQNRDGSNDNRSWNSGAEGPTDDPAIIELRRRRHRSLLTTLLLSTGTPMLLAGDEMAKSQRGNNNAYCQDNELSWLEWDLAEEALVHFTAGLVQLRSDHAVFRRRRFFSGVTGNGSDTPDLEWFDPAGSRMTGADWAAGWTKAIAVYLNGDNVPSRSRTGKQRRSDSFFSCFNASDNAVVFALPPPEYGDLWTVAVDTASTSLPPVGAEPVPAGGKVTVAPFGVVVLQRGAAGPDDTQGG
jgi:isoamylase